LAEQYCFARADLIVACGSRVAETLRAKGYKKALRVVALPVDVEAFRPCAEMRAEGRASLGLSESDLVIGYAGKLVEEKGLGALWQAFAGLAQEYPNLHLLLAGRGPMLEVLRESAREVGLEDRLHVPGVVHNSDLPRFMNAMDIFVLPSETRPNWREQFGRAIVEAMACGVAAVGSDSGEIPDVVGEAGLVFPEGDASALASALGELLSDAPLRERLAQAGRRRALALYSVDEVAAKHYRLYEEAEANL
jgi:glycosyltransferase involved in cell wall biosynthesis